MKKRVTLVLISCFIMLTILNVFVILIFPIYPLKQDPFTGNGLVGTIQLIIEGAPEDYYINVTSPQNITYNFNVGDSYIIDLNVSANFNANWQYILYDVKHNTQRSFAFGVNKTSVNTTFGAYRWSNVISVSGIDEFDRPKTVNVSFFAFVPDSAPVIENLSSNIYVCESSRLSYLFNVTDVDEDSILLDISPKDPFWISPYYSYGPTNTVAQIFSGILTKNNLGNHPETVSARDGQYADSEITNITVIEINNAPLVSMGVRTIWTSGEDSNFYESDYASDTEVSLGRDARGYLVYNLTFFNSDSLFNISEEGIMNFTPNSSQVGVYNISICVQDGGLANIPSNISLCNQTGLSIETCTNFSLTVTNENRPPQITDYSPLDLSFSANDTDTLQFNITKYDADGTIPDSYWYVDGIFKKYSTGNSTDSFSYVFGCDISGNHNISVVVSDGLLNTSLQWNVSLINIECPKPPAIGSGGGGGGGGGAMGCIPKWACSDWQLCQNLKLSYDAQIISPEDYFLINGQCKNNSYDERYCGFQIRTCRDLNSCNSSFFGFNISEKIQSCYYTENPGCSDGITNCHDGGCEILADCGGPCKQCPTCSDGIQNQGEQGIDCGSPCPWKCSVESPLAKSQINILLYILGLIILIILIIIIIKARRIFHSVKKIKAVNEG